MISKQNPFKQIQYIVLFLVVLMFVFALYMDSFLQVEPLGNERTITLDNTWDAYLDGELLASGVSLPYVFPKPLIGKECTLTTILPSVFPNDNTCINVESSMAALDVFLDGEKIYSLKGPDKGWARPVFGGNFANFIRIPNSAQGKKLSLTYRFTSKTPFAGSVKAPIMGSKASLILLKHAQWPSLVFGYTLLFVGFICITVPLGMYRGKERDSFIHFGWLQASLGAWVFSQSSSKLLIIRNPALPMNLSFIALYLLPFFLVNYVCTSYTVGKSIKLMRKISLVFPFAYVVGGLLQLFGILQYTDLLVVSGLWLGIFLLVLLAMLFANYLKGETKLASFLIAMAILLFTILVEEVLLIFNIKLDSPVLLHFGMSLSGAILFWHSAKQLTDRTRSILKEQVLLSMAYTDSLTGLNNRSAYDKRIDEISSASYKAEVLGVLVMDINDLKVINDTKGHKEGDITLKDFTSCILKLLPEKAEVFRIGGDEFVAFIPTITDDHLEKLATAITEFFKARKNLYTVAVGYSLFIPKKKEKFINIIHCADSSMYLCKAIMKQQRVVNLDS
ncbi:MAG: GGDEF domain-containing protein [Sphaerochaeta sp.]